jgi:ABC-type dipeptide/oligopeptide/nickel transport system ATPase subunit
MIEIKDTTKTFGKKQNAFTALKDISLRIDDGQTVYQSQERVAPVKAH